jgi:hypothetical protein
VELGIGEIEVVRVGGQVERHTAGSVPGSVDNFGEKVAPLEDVALLEELMNLDEFGRVHADEGGLDFHAAVEREIIAVHHDRSAGVLIELGAAADVVDVSVCADDGFDCEFVAAEEAEDALDLIAGINDDGLECAGVADDGAVALEHADGDLDVDHLRVGGVGQAMAGIHGVHRGKYIIGLLGHHGRKASDAGGLLD